MKKNKVIGIVLLSGLFFSGLQAADYKMEGDKKQPKYSEDVELDRDVKELRRDLGITVNPNDLNKSIKASNLVGHNVFSSDGNKVGRIHDILFSESGDVIFIISSGGILPKLDLGDTERAVYAYNTYLFGKDKYIRLVMTESEFKKEPIVR